MKDNKNTKSVPHLGLILCLVLTAMTFAVYGQARNGRFIHYDDHEYVVDNPQVRYGLTLEGVKWAFTEAHARNWHPLTWLSHMLDCELYGLNPMGHHLNSLLLHVVNTLLLFSILKKMTGATWRSAFVAALFALHPLHVESVAWVAERKDVLSTFFWMMTLWAYVRYADRQGFGTYLLTLLFFVSGLMAKAMLVTIPFVLLLLDYWPLGRTRFAAPFTEGLTGVRRKRDLIQLFAEKAPFFLFSGLSGAVTLLAQQHGGALPSSIPLKIRTANAVYSYALYLEKMLWPRDLAVFYPHPGHTLTPWQVGGAALILAALSFFAVIAARRIPYLIVGWLWYLGTLVPVIGIIQVGSQAMADRYTYVPLIGLFVAISWGAHRIAGKSSLLKGAVPVLAGIAVLGLSAATMHQVSHWKDTKTLFRHALEVTSANVLAHNNLGNALASENKTEEAAHHFREAIRISPGDATIHNNLGNVLMETGGIDEAVSHYREALRIDPDFEAARYNLDRALKESIRAGKSPRSGPDPGGPAGTPEP